MAKKNTRKAPVYRPKKSMLNKTPKGSAESHEQLLRAIRQYCSLVLKWPSYRTDVAPVAGKDGRFRPRSEPGVPDLLVMIGNSGLTGFCEVKTGGGRLTPAQKFVREQLTASNAPYAIIHSLNEFMEWTDSLKRKHLEGATNGIGNALTPAGHPRNGRGDNGTPGSAHKPEAVYPPRGGAGRAGLNGAKCQHDSPLDGYFASDLPERGAA